MAQGKIVYTIPIDFARREAYLSTVLGIIGGLILLTILVVAHEWGHFAVGRACDMKIEEFAAGFGPKLLSKVKNGIRYSIRALPLGGFVQFYGEDSQEAGSEPRAFNNKPIWQRFLTLLAGPAMNILLAFVITVGVLIGYGDFVPTVASVQEGMPAEQVGLQVGDRITSVDGKRIDFAMEFEGIDLTKSGQSVLLGIERNGEQMEFEIPLQYSEEEGRSLIGITYSTATRQRFGFFEAIGLSFKWMYLIIAEMFAFLGDLIFRGQGVEGLAGPVGTIGIVSQAVRSGPEVILRIATLLSINLGIMNLLPIPGLDGGRIVLLGVEKLRGKPLSQNKEGLINLIGMGLLFLFMIFLTYQDIARLLS